MMIFISDPSRILFPAILKIDVILLKDISIVFTVIRMDGKSPFVEIRSIFNNDENVFSVD